MPIDPGGNHMLAPPRGRSGLSTGTIAVHLKRPSAARHLRQLFVDDLDFPIEHETHGLIHPGSGSGQGFFGALRDHCNDLQPVRLITPHRRHDRSGLSRRSPCYTLHRVLLRAGKFVLPGSETVCKGVSRPPILSWRVSPLGESAARFQSENSAIESHRKTSGALAPINPRPQDAPALARKAQVPPFTPWLSVP